ncbi:Rpn family recombination-promoting nuclease/putative transposase [Clostridium sp. OM07-10AC]|jgi:predicted transposase/invertase (TIGR01784 family)|nr:Rpn family recombination-promoting nuclease/putative transposase [Clostridium sp. OM07-9AC]RHV02490.1 Rpn family recombination-promoting nuclease/putative transposase [Clostridium sp. OM07-10AC]
MDCYQILYGQDYKELKSSIVIFLCTFNLFDQNRSIYTFQSLCREEPKISLMDHRQTIFVNINGSRQDLSPELANFLDSLKTTEPTDDFTDRLNSSVKKLRNDFDWRENYMTLEMKLKEQYNAGIKQGREEGKAEAIMDLIRQKLANGKSTAQIASECERSVETIQDLIAEMELKQ